MSDTTERQRAIIDAESRPVLPRFVKLQHDKGRDRWVLLAPERILTPDEIAVAVLRLCDGERSVGNIASELAEEYDAPAGQILADIIELVQNLADKGYLKS
ncbi:coenzyme PQQ synthesis protein D [bacterium MnTg02]|nr:coenzyme PQQ synthesis protein D [bacterium MnTg02]